MLAALVSSARAGSLRARSPDVPRGARLRAPAVLVLLAFALAGCMKVDARLTVRGDDTISGAVVMAVDKRLGGLTGKTEDQLVSTMGMNAADLPATARAEPYADEHFVGRRIVFDRTPLAGFSGTGGSSAITIRHSGHEYALAGVVDLSSVRLDDPAVKPFADLFSFKISITFPGKVVEHNGVLDGQTVTWQPEPGEHLALRALAQEPRRVSALPIVAAGAGLAVLAAIGGVVLVVRRHPAAPRQRVAETPHEL
jgi:hypothetical protein